MAVCSSSRTLASPSERSRAAKKFKTRISNLAESGNQSATTDASSPPRKIKKRNSSPGVRVRGSRIYDSHNGKTCHQCRQKTMDFMASCKKITEDKQCTFRFCQKCLLNRYGEKAKETAWLIDWICPRCRGICNCSFCMKKRGHQPTGILIHAAKANGFCSVSELLHHDDLENLLPEKTVRDDERNYSKKRKSSNKEASMAAVKKFGKHNSFQGQGKLDLLANLLETRLMELEKSRNGESDNASECDKNVHIAQKSSPKKFQLPKEASNQSFNRKNEACPYTVHHDDIVAEHQPFAKSYKSNRKLGMDVERNTSDIGLLPSQDIELRNVAAVGINAEDVGHALRFLEFCEAVAKEHAVGPIRNRGKHCKFEVHRYLELQAEAFKENAQEVETRKRKVKNSRKENAQEVEPRKSKVKKSRNKDANENAFRTNSSAASIMQKISPEKQQIPMEAFRRSEKDGKIFRRDAEGKIIRANSDTKVGPKTLQESIKMKSMKAEALNNANHDYTILELKSVAASHKSNKKCSAKVNRSSDDELMSSQCIVLKCATSVDIPEEEVEGSIPFLDIC